jgi:hypothetical protein
MKHRRATINKKRTLSRGLAATAGVGIVLGLFALPADAAEPANQACVGESLSALAGPGFGEAIVFFAQVGGPFNTHPGFGDGMQRLQAGAIPDQVAPNTCNNP